MPTFFSQSGVWFYYYARFNQLGSYCSIVGIYRPYTTSAVCFGSIEFFIQMHLNLHLYHAVEP
jgi:hypothetical protein